MQINIDKLVREFEDRPDVFVAATAALLIGISKVVSAVGDARGSHAYARDVNRRIKLAKKQ